MAGANVKRIGALTMESRSSIGHSHENAPIDETDTYPRFSTNMGAQAPDPVNAQARDSYLNKQKSLFFHSPLAKSFITSSVAYPSTTMSDTTETAQAPGAHTSVLRPVTVKNTGNKVLIFVTENPHETFKLPPGVTRRLGPNRYRVQVDLPRPGPNPIIIAKIVYDPKWKKFDIQAEDGVDGAKFETNVDLEAVGKHTHAADAADD